MAKLRNIPVEGQRIEFRQFDVVIRKMNESRIVFVQIYPNETADMEIH